MERKRQAEVLVQRCSGQVGKRALAHPHAQNRRKGLVSLGTCPGPRSDIPAQNSLKGRAVLQAVLYACNRRVIPTRLDSISDINKQLFTAHYGANGNGEMMSRWPYCTPLQKMGVVTRSRRTTAANAINQFPLKKSSEMREP